MVDYLLEERGERLDNFLAHHEDIAWIRLIEEGKFTEARQTLKHLVSEATNNETKATIAALGKLCALCEEQEDAIEIGDFSRILESLERSAAPTPSTTRAESVASTSVA